MKKKIIILISALLVFGLAIVAYSVTKSTAFLNTSESCCAMKDCCKDGVCKMGGECCKKHDSSQVKQKDSTEMTAMNHGDKAECCKDGKCTMDCCKDGKCTMGCCKDGKCTMDCCKDGKCTMGCCKDGKCDMKKKDGEPNTAKAECCKGKDSCPMHKGENKDKPKDN